MRNKLVISPKTLSLITTYKCTSACKDCCFQCNPKRPEMLHPIDMKKIIAESCRNFPTIQVVVFTGGECTLLDNDLEDLISYSHKKSLITRIVTNAHWAVTYEKAFEKLKKLKSAGLNEINYSTGDDHCKFVPLDYISNACRASLDLDMITIVNFESAPDRTLTVSALTNRCELKPYLSNFKKNSLQIISGEWMPFKKSTEKKMISHSHGNKHFVVKGQQRCSTLFNTITIDPNYHMIACCGLTAEYNKYLDLGCVKSNSLKTLYEQQFNDLVKIWLYTEGAVPIMKFISNKLKLQKPFMNPNSHMCQICEKIFNEPQYLNTIKDSYKDIYGTILFKYCFLKKIENTDKEK